jgi:hypothetical protein
MPMTLAQAHRRHLEAVLPFQHNLHPRQLEGTAQPAFLQNQAGRRFVGALRTGVRPVAARLQARQTERGVAFKMFVAGLAADCKRSIRT